MIPRIPLALAASVVGAALPAPAAGAAPLTATDIRIADHPGFVRVVVDFRGGRVETGEVNATDPNPFPDGLVRLPLSRSGVQTTAAPAEAEGVRAVIRQRSGRIVIRLRGETRRFKYASYRALRAPHRLVIDLFKSRPPRAAAEIRRAPDRCLSLRSHEIRPRRVLAAGRERNLFEHSLLVRLRRTDGRVHAQQGETAANRRWRTSFRIPGADRQAGTLEAVALSAKDGTLDCLVQIRVRFGAP